MVVLRQLPLDFQLGHDVPREALVATEKPGGWGREGVMAGSIRYAVTTIIYCIKIGSSASHLTLRGPSTLPVEENYQTCYLSPTGTLLSLRGLKEQECIIYCLYFPIEALWISGDIRSQFSLCLSLHAFSSALSFLTNWVSGVLRFIHCWEYWMPSHGE